MRDRVKGPRDYPGSAGPHTLVAAALLVLPIFAVYWRAHDAPFIFDDNSAIVTNKSIVSLTPLVGTQDHPGPLKPPPELPTASRPLVNLSFALNYHFGGLNPTGYHLVNVTVHWLSALLVWAIVRRTLRLPYFGEQFATSPGWLALAAAMIWALHPLQTEAVIYATQRTELMMAFFYLGTLYCSLRYWTVLPLPSGEGWSAGDTGKKKHPHPALFQSERVFRAVWLVLAVLSCLGGMASKEVMVSAPLVVLLFERTFLAGSLAATLRRSWPLYIGLASTWLLLLALNWRAQRGASAGFALGLPVYPYWLTQAKVLLLYMKLVLWPWPLLIHYQLPYLFTLGEAWMYVLSVILIGAATLALLWQNHPIGFVAAWVAAILAPTSVIPIYTEMAAERRMYLALAPLAALGVVISYRLAKRPREWARGRETKSGCRIAAIGIGSPIVLLVIVFGLVSARRLSAYHDEQGLWEDVLRYQPENYVAHQNVGFYLDKAGKTAEAIEHFREAIRLSPDAAQAHYSLGVLLTRTDPEQAVQHFSQAARKMPMDPTMRNNLGFALFMAGRNDEAISAFRTALELDPNRWMARNNLGLALQRAGRYNEALDCFDQALRVNPKALDIYNDVANTYALMNQRDKAIAVLERGLELARASGDAENAERFAARLKENR
jgi:protein O-mannosyl-transferase